MHESWQPVKLKFAAATPLTCPAQLGSAASKCCTSCCVWSWRGTQSYVIIWLWAVARNFLSTSFCGASSSLLSGSVSCAPSLAYMLFSFSVAVLWSILLFMWGQQGNFRSCFPSFPLPWPPHIPPIITSQYTSLKHYCKLLAQANKCYQQLFIP